jgi:ribosomal protein L37E
MYQLAEEIAVNCRSCGRQIPDDSMFCPYCGYSLTGQMTSYQEQAQAKSGMSAGMVITIVIVVFVIVPIVLSAVLYVMVLGFGSYGSATPSILITSRTAISNPDGYRFALSAPTSEVSWTDLTIVLQTGADSAVWSTATQSSLTATGVATQALGARTLGSMSVFVNITDMGGNGYINNGDYFTITGTFASFTSYTLTLLYEPTDGQMVAQTWTV